MDELNQKESAETEQNLEKAKPRFNWRRSLITVVLVLISAGVVGGVTWYLMDKNAKDLKVASDKSVTELEATITDLKKELESKITVSADIKNQSAASLSDEDYLIVNTTKKAKVSFPTEYAAVKITANDGTWAVTNPIPIIFSSTTGYSIPGRGGSNYLWYKENNTWTYVGSGGEGGWDQAVQSKFNVIPKTIIPDDSRTSV